MKKWRIVMKIDAVNKYVLVRILKREKTPGGIILPPTKEFDDINRGKIVSIGPDTPGHFLNEEDIVLFVQQVGNSFKKDGTEYTFVEAEDILGVEDLSNEN
jgi:co-chaperonin GroES (HSP10)